MPPKRTSEHKKDTLFGLTHRVPYESYCDHVSSMQGTLDREIALPNGQVIDASSPDFDDGAIEAMDFGSFLDNLSDDEEYFEAHREKEEVLVRHVARGGRETNEIAQVLSGKKRVKLTPRERAEYSSAKDKAAWKPTDYQLHDMKRQYQHVRKATLKKTSNYVPPDPATFTANPANVSTMGGRFPWEQSLTSK